METTQQFVISKPKAEAVAWCQACADNVRMVTAELAAVMTGVSPREIYRSIESGQLHFAETSEGFLLIA